MEPRYQEAKDEIKMSIGQDPGKPELILRVTNDSNDTIVFPRAHLQRTFTVEGVGIFQAHSTVVKIAIPQSDFDDLRKRDKEKVIWNNCRPYSLNTGFWLLGPRDSLDIKVAVSDLGYQGFLSGSEYHVSCLMFASEELKSYCPMIWTGMLEANSSFLMP